MCIRDSHNPLEIRFHRNLRVVGLHKSLGPRHDARLRIGEVILHPGFGLSLLLRLVPVSYTHLDVYKRQVPEGLVGVYRVVSLSPDGQTANIEKFDVSRQKSLGDPVRSVAIDKLTAYKEDPSQAAARIVREATTED